MTLDFFSGYSIEAELQIVGLKMVRIFLFTPRSSPLFGAPVTFMTFSMYDSRFGLIITEKVKA